LVAVAVVQEKVLERVVVRMQVVMLMLVAVLAQ
jgi:hypothetical protein